MDGHGAGAGGGVGLGACVQAQGVKAGIGVTGHLVSPKVLVKSGPGAAFGRALQKPEHASTARRAMLTWFVSKSTRFSDVGGTQ
jgi:hypothetical protein